MSSSRARSSALIPLPSPARAYSSSSSWERALIRAKTSASSVIVGLPRPREAEVDLRRPGVGPARGHDLGPGVELDPLRAVHVDVAEQRALPAAEAVVGDRDRDGDVDPDHPRLDLELELTGRAAVAGEDRGPVAVRVVV